MIAKDQNRTRRRAPRGRLGPPKLFFCDVETTGRDPSRHGIHQIAGILLAGGAEKRFNHRVAPFPGDQIDDEALGISGVSRRELPRYPKPGSVYRKLDRLLGRYVDRYNSEDKFHFVGYNARFDWEFLQRFFNRNAAASFGCWFWWPPLDVMALAAFVLAPERPALPDFKLATVAAHLGVVTKKSHQARCDIQATREIYEELWRRLATLRRRRTLRSGVSSLLL